MPAENAFDLPALSVNALKEAALHLAAIRGGRPAARSPAAFDGCNAVGSEFVTDHFMKGLGVAAGIPDRAPEAYPPMGFAQHNGCFDCVTARTDSDRCAEKKMGGNVDTGGELGPTRDIEVLLAASGTVVMGGVAHFETGAVAGGLSSRSNQSAAPGAPKNTGEEQFKE